MANIIQPDTLKTELDDIKRRLRALETAPSLTNSSIKEGSTVILDAAGTRRVILGKDPADGAYGVKVYAANGTTLLMDALGLVKVEGNLNARVKVWGLSTLAGVAGPPTGLAGFGGEVDCGGGNLTFTLTRTQTIRILGMVTAVNWQSVIAPTFIGSPIYVRVVGQTNSFGAGVSQNLATAGNAGTVAPTAATVMQILTLPAASYTVNLWWNPLNGTNDNLDVYSYALYVSLVGS